MTDSVLFFPIPGPSPVGGDSGCGRDPLPGGFVRVLMAYDSPVLSLGTMRSTGLSKNRINWSEGARAARLPCYDDGLGRKFYGAHDAASRQSDPEPP
jgi:hypothetical protein